MAFVTPNPKPLPKYLALISPFHYFVWASFAVAMVVIAVVFYCFSIAETNIMGIEFTELNEIDEAAWYSFGTMLGEGFEVKSASRGHALRFVNSRVQAQLTLSTVQWPVGLGATHVRGLF